MLETALFGPEKGARFFDLAGMTSVIQSPPMRPPAIFSAKRRRGWALSVRSRNGALIVFGGLAAGAPELCAIILLRVRHMNRSSRSEMRAFKGKPLSILASMVLSSLGAVGGLLIFERVEQAIWRDTRVGGLHVVATAVIVVIFAGVNYLLMNKYRGLQQELLDEINDRIRIEEDLKRKNDYLENITENSPDAIGIVDGRGKLIKWNRMAAEMFGYPPDELLGRPAFNLYADAKELDDMLRELRSGGVVKKREMSLKAKDGRLFSAELSLGLIRDSENKVIGSVCVARDLSELRKAWEATQAANEGLQREISERRQIEQALSQSENTYRTIFENTAAATLIVDDDGTIFLANAQCEKLVGRSREKLEGGRKWTEFVAEDDSARMKKYSELRKVDPSSVPYQYEFRIVDGHGGVKPVMATIGKIPGTSRTVASLLDMTEFRKMEADLLNARKHESIGMLAAGVAHDFNNLLGIVLGNISLAGLSLGPESEASAPLATAEKTVLQAKHLTERLLNASKAAAPIKTTESLRGLIVDAVELALLGSSVKCRLRIPDDLWRVDCDSMQIHQAITNLAVNAREASEEGGVIDVSAENERLAPGRIPASMDGRCVKIAITDHGKGIPQEALSRVFDPYFSTKERGTQKGMGLGLTAAYSIARSHGGRILIESAPDSGTTVIMYLPASRDAGEGETC